MVCIFPPGARGDCAGGYEVRNEFLALYSVDSLSRR